MATLNAIDVSNFTGPIPMRLGPTFRDFARRLIVNTHDTAIAVPQLEVAKKNCMEAQIYAFQYLSIPIQRELGKAKSLRTIHGDLFTWLDFENASIDVGGAGQDNVSTDVILGWIGRVIWAYQHEGFDVGIYTSPTWWQKWTRDEPYWFRDLGIPVWSAEAGVTTPSLVGGVKPAMHQYALDQDYAGLNVDFNTYEE